jgi:hypothetical protein
MKKIIILAVVSSLLLGLAACNKTSAGVVAIVNGVEITQEAFDAELEYDLEYYNKEGITLTDQELAELKKGVVDRLINTHLLKEAAIKAGIDADSVDVETELAAVIENFDDEATFNKALEDADFTLESYKQVLAEMMMIEALFEQELAITEIQVEEEQIQAMVQYYMENYDEEDEVDQEELREFVIYSLKQQKAESLRKDFIEKLRGDSEIKYLDF